MAKNDELYHYGVLGMKWGQKRAAAKMDRITKRSKKQGWSDDATEAAKIKTKKVNQMSNKELTAINNRKNLERNYSQLNPNAIKKGIAIAGATVAAMGTLSALYKYGKRFVSVGEKASKNFIQKNRNKTASSKFWKEMKNVSTMGSDWRDILK